MYLLRQETAFLLDMPLRFSNMQRVHGRKFVGSHLQRSLLAVPRVWRPEAVLNEKGIGVGHEAFSSVPRFPPWSFLRLIYGGESCPLRIPDFVGLRFPPLLSREKHGGLPPVTLEKTSCPFNPPELEWHNAMGINKQVMLLQAL